MNNKRKSCCFFPASVAIPFYPKETKTPSETTTQAHDPGWPANHDSIFARPCAHSGELSTYVTGTDCSTECCNRRFSQPVNWSASAPGTKAGQQFGRP